MHSALENQILAPQKRKKSIQNSKIIDHSKALDTAKANLRRGDQACEICDIVWNANELYRRLNGKHH